jgi:LacI family transcriptional regulator
VEKVTIAEVAGRAQVSAMTVSRVVNGSQRVAERTRRRVERAMAELGYIPNRVARGLVVNRLDVLALVIPDISNPFFTKVARAVESTANAAGYTVILGNSDEDRAKEEAYLRAVSSLRVDGIVLAPASRASRESLESLRRRGIPVVLLDRKVDGMAGDLVRGESVEASGALVEHLVDHGHRRIAMISGPSDVSTALDRERGYRQALERRGLHPDPTLFRHAEYTREGGHREALGLLGREDPPTAIFAANNFLAFGVMDATRQMGLRVPDDVAVVTIDDVEIAADEPFLTCADQPAEALGRAATQLLIGRLGGDESPPREIVLPAEVRIRRSCGRHDPSDAG